MILPDAMLGMLGGGQLGRMFTLAAHAMGYRVTVLDPDPQSPAGAIADVHLKAAYQDREALQQLADTCEAVTTEFENVPAESLRWLAAHCVVSPAGDCVAIAQDRIREKRFLTQQDCGTAPYAVIERAADLATVDPQLFPGILKRARSATTAKASSASRACAKRVRRSRRWAAKACVLEQRIALAKELSLVIARGADGRCSAFPVAENLHADGILDVSIVPARIAPRSRRRPSSARSASHAHSATSVCSRSNFSCFLIMAGSSSTRSRRDRITAAITRSTRVLLPSSSSRCARCAACHSARRACSLPP